MFVENLLMYTTALIAIAFATVYAFFKYRYGTWERAKIPFLEPTFPFGNGKDFILLRRSFGETFRKLYNDLKKKTSTFGGIYFFAKPRILVIDPELIKTIWTRDFDHFIDRNSGFADNVNDPLSAHLVFLNGQKWKNARTKITPTFTSGKMKMMFHTMLETSKELENILDEHKDLPIDIREIFARQSTDVIGSCAFGIECNSLKDPDNEFRQQGRKIFTFDLRAVVVNLFTTNFPSILTFFKIPRIRSEISVFFMRVLRETIEKREQNNIQRKDFLDLMIKLKNKQSVLDELIDDPKINEEGLTFNEIAAHCFVFFAAGFETTSTTMNFCMYELSCNKEVQQKAREEILSVMEKHDGNLTYEGIMEMKYVDRVFQEVLRKYPPIHLLQRECTADYLLPNTDFVIKKGTEINVSTLGIHRDPEYYPNPDKFDPERFSEEEKAKRHPYTHLPFGNGPRNCIGSRFALLQVKIVLSTLLKDFRFTLDPKTVSPIVLDPTSIFLSPKDTVWLRAERIKK